MTDTNERSARGRNLILVKKKRNRKTERKANGHPLEVDHRTMSRLAAVYPLQVRGLGQFTREAGGT